MSELLIDFLKSVNWALITGGFWGASIYAFVKRSTVKGPSAVGSIVTGIVVANYCGEWMAAKASAVATAFVGSEVTVAIGPAGFLCGLGGLTIVQTIISLIDSKGKSLTTSPSREPSTDTNKPITNEPE